MCEREPSRVLHYLRAHPADQLATYRADVVLDLCRQHGLLDAQVHLLEMGGQHRAGFDLFCGDLEGRIHTYLETLEQQQEAGVYIWVREP
jgi:hypothetical protein